ncbi:tyrosine-type recombinase/integrase [Nonomuraea sp. NPDC049709]|uniref:tyrosine-type recombinase/integrase n=1 Tax=Nonomuraea sp. NPDC049709 TaxID=3154736 RepID=UPI003417568D
MSPLQAETGRHKRVGLAPLHRRSLICRQTLQQRCHARLRSRRPHSRPANSATANCRRALAKRPPNSTWWTSAATRQRRSSAGSGCSTVRYGKAKKGQPPRRRNVLSVMDWAVEAVADYVENVRPRFGCTDHPALWVTERGGRVKPAEINARFVAYRDALGLPAALVVHSLRHSYVTHLTEEGVDRRFIQTQVGHESDSSTAVYTHVSDDFMNTALRRALAPVFGAEHDGRSRRTEER